MEYISKVKIGNTTYLLKDSNAATSSSLSGYATESWVNGKINDLVGIDASGVEALKTVLSDNDTTTGLLTAIAGKVDKNGTDRLMTAAEGTKLSNIESGALAHKAPTSLEVKSALGTGSGTTKYLREDGTWATPPDTNTWPTATSQLTNDSGYITGITSSMVTSALGYTPASSDSDTVTSINGKTGAIAASDIAAVLTAAGYALTDTNTWPTYTSLLTNDSGYITSSGSCNYATSAGSAPASDVYSWAKQSTKPSYSASEVGALRNYGADSSRPNNTTFSLPDGANPVQMRSGATDGPDVGIFHLSDDNAFVCNSSDQGYLFAAFDTDHTTDFTSANNASFAVLSDEAGVNMKGNLAVAGSITSGGYGVITSANIGSQNVNYASSAGSVAWSNVSSRPTALSSFSNDAGYITGITNTMVTEALGYTPSSTDTNTWRPLGTGANDACAGNDSRLSDARPASDVYSWAKAASKPSYTLAEVGATASVVAITAATSSTCSITGSANAGKSETIIYTNSTSGDLVVTVPTTYVTDTGAALELTAKAGGYCEVNYLNIGGTIYARGL